MYVIEHEWRGLSRSDTFRLVPIGDVHAGSRACDEAKFAAIVQSVKRDPRAYWIGLGDYCEFINVSDVRHDVQATADWITKADLVDISKAQRDWFLEHVRPIADKCLGLVEGNHERTIRRKYERDVYREIVATVKGWGGKRADERLGLGVYGWLLLRFKRNGGQQQPSAVVRVNVHHGFVAGRLAGAKALNMQRWLWTHNADLVIFGHCHEMQAQRAAVEELDFRGNVRLHLRRGMYAGSFVKTVAEGPAVYTEERGYFPSPTGCPEAILRPGAKSYEDRVAIVC